MASADQGRIDGGPQGPGGFCNLPIDRIIGNSNVAQACVVHFMFYRLGIMTPDPYRLDRFVSAQAERHEAALAEIRRGRKRSHWMWFVFPQLAGLGHSAIARTYAIASLDEARAYLDHPILGERLRACVAALQDLDQSDPEAVFGPVDALKLRSSLTLFALAGGGRLFDAALERWFDGARDEVTVTLLGERS